MSVPIDPQTFKPLACVFGSSGAERGRAPCSVIESRCCRSLGGCRGPAGLLLIIVHPGPHFVGQGPFLDTRCTYVNGGTLSPWWPHIPHIVFAYEDVQLRPSGSVFHGYAPFMDLTESCFQTIGEQYDCHHFITSSIGGVSLEPRKHPQLVWCSIKGQNVAAGKQKQNAESWKSVNISVTLPWWLVLLCKADVLHAGLTGTRIKKTL